MDYIEILGYIAMLLVAVSFLMKDVVKLRLINALGCSCFVVYGLLINAIPVLILNLMVAGINIYFAFKIAKEKKTA